MKNISLFFCFMLCSSLVLGRQFGNDSTATIQTVLFKITHAKTQKTSFLFGTHHAFGKSLIDSLQNVRKALLSSDVLIKENLNIPGHLAKDIINKRTDQTLWKKYLDQEDLQYVKNIFASSETDFTKMSPTELHVFLSRYHKERVCSAKDATDSYLSLDDYLGSVAKAQNLDLIGLETIEEQIALINQDVAGMPRKIHKKRLSRMINGIRANTTSDCQEIDWYRKMDFDYKFNQPCQNALVLTDRNTRWMKKIEVQLESSNCFIAVGLSHLMYTCGLINQLKELGHTVTPVEII